MIENKPDVEMRDFSKSNFFRRPVSQYTIDGILVENFDSVKAAAKKMNTRRYNISHALTGYSKTCCGFVWKYFGEYRKYKREM